MKIIIDDHALTERIRQIVRIDEVARLLTPDDLPLSLYELADLEPALSALDPSTVSLEGDGPEELLDIGVELVDTGDESTLLVITAAVMAPGTVATHYVPQAHLVNIRLTDFWALGDREGFAPVAAALETMATGPGDDSARRLVADAVTDQRRGLCLHLVDALNAAVAADRSFWCRHLGVPDTERIDQVTRDIDRMQAALQRLLVDGRGRIDELAYRIDLARARRGSPARRSRNDLPGRSGVHRQRGCPADRRVRLTPLRDPMRTELFPDRKNHLMYDYGKSPSNPPRAHCASRGNRLKHTSATRRRGTG